MAQGRKKRGGETERGNILGTEWPDKDKESCSPGWADFRIEMAGS